MSHTDTPKPGSSPLYTPRDLKAKKAQFIRMHGTDLDGAYRYNGRAREKLEAQEAEKGAE